MQQRLNNRWLSPLLLESVQKHIDTQKAQRRPSDSRRTRDVFDKTSSDVTSARPARYQSIQRPHRRLWQHLATGLLLIGSAAFSYLAWSQSGAGAQALKLLVDNGGISKAVHVTVPEHASPADRRRSVSQARARVHTLRNENRALQLRIAQLQADIDNSDL